MSVLLAGYFPVIHAGHLAWFDRYATEKPGLAVFGHDILDSMPRLERDLRALPAGLVARMAETLRIFREVETVTFGRLRKSASEASLVVFPDEGVTREVVSQHLKELPLEKIRFESVFLRWDRMATLNKPIPSGVPVASQEEHLHFMRLAFKEAEKSSDFWRRVGAVFVKNGEVVHMSHNRHLPTDRSPYIDGDPRSNFDAGERTDLSTPAHSEFGGIAELANLGVSTKGMDIYVTTFPCPICARQIVLAGIRRVYFSEGYSVLGAEDLFAHFGVELFRVPFKPPS